MLPHVRQCVRVRQALAGADPLRAGLAGLLDNSGIGVLQPQLQRAPARRTRSWTRFRARRARRTACEARNRVTAADAIRSSRR